jgi:hypothetical protein
MPRSLSVRRSGTRPANPLETAAPRCIQEYPVIRLYLSILPATTMIRGGAAQTISQEDSPMARQKAATELEALRQQQIELAKRIKEAEIRARQKEKAENERREQLAGRAVLSYLATNPQSDAAKAIVGILETTLVKPAERALFFGASATPNAAGARANSYDANAAPRAESGVVATEPQG